MNAAKISDARIEAACDYMYDVYSDDERERMRGVLEAADEAEAPPRRATGSGVANAR